MRLSDFDYALPEASIARYPAPRRDASRLFVVDRQRRSFSHHTFDELPDLLRAGDRIVANDTKVLAGRLITKKVTGGRVELLLIEPLDEEATTWKAMAQGSKSLRAGATLSLADDVDPIEVVSTPGAGFVEVRLPLAIEAIEARFGALPLPPYLKRSAESEDEDRYQTIFAGGPSRSVAAPTAGLHFTPELKTRLSGGGIDLSTVTLHVGPGTFLPVRTDDVEDHVMHSERYELGRDSASAISATRAAGGRIVAVGTTVTRVLETRGWPLTDGSGATDLFIRPGFDFQVVDALITNFHLPKSTLLMLVAAFADRDLVLAAYEEAIARGYRFYSYGDAMLLV